jgi:translocation and assembly module TamB
VPLAAIAEMAGATLPLRTTLTLAGEWDIAPGRPGTLSLRRQQGDLYVGRNGTLETGEIALGFSRLEASATLADGALAATFDAAATRVGTVRGNLAIGRGRGADPGQIDADAPVSGTVVAQLASLAPLQPFIGTAARVDGRVDADLQLGGTLKAVTVTGRLSGTGLRLDAPAYGLHWGDGVLQATLADDRLTLDEFSFRAGDGKFAASGVIAVASPRDDAGARDAASGVGIGTRLTWRANRLRATNRPDLRLVVSGNGELAFAEKHLAVTGSLTVDEGRVDIETTAPGTTLGDDVVIVGRPPPQTASAKRFGAVPFGVDLALDLGPALQITGEGLQARLGGRVRVSAAPDGVLTAKGTIRAVNGSYYAFGQRLSIDRGRLIFDGPIDNPALDIIALRKNLQVEAGVRVTGTARVPRVELTSEPPVPDGEKLSWLVLGQGLDQSTTGGDTAALQAAAATLFGAGRMPIGTTLAQSMGLDDIAVRGSSSLASTEGNVPRASRQVLAVSKRLSDKLYIVYEQGISVANNALKIEYALTRNITLRAEAGLISGVGIYYRKSLD